MSQDSRQDARSTAKRMYWQGYTLAEISRELGLNESTLASWKRRDGWDSAPVVERVESAIDARLIQLLAKREKGDKDLREIEVLTKQLERTARIRRFQDGGDEGDLNPKVKNRNAKPKRKPRKNEISDDALRKMREAFHDLLFGYQREWLRQRQDGRRIRNILKSRQIGATYYFALEALLDAAENADNQIFLSASRAQAHVFRNYIVQFARQAADVELQGDPIVLANGAELHFLGTNYRTAQSYHGHLYFDEYFWVHRFNDLNAVASGMATHKKWTKTYFSTPSSVGHEAYPFWTGEHYNRGRQREDHIHIDTSHKALAAGRLCEDRQWRQIVTVEDAESGGCDLFDLEELRHEYSAERFRQLFMCEFIDDSSSIWPLSVLQRCLVDSWLKWDDFRPHAPRPLGDRPVWLGYDPSRVRDGAAVVVVAPPVTSGGKYRVLEKHYWTGVPFPEQAKRIREITKRYRVEHLEIDCTGPGALAVADLVAEFHPGVRRSTYTPQVKTELVARAMNVIGNGRLEYDSGWQDLTSSLMGIRQDVTPNGQVTYSSGRSEDIGHADLGWALLHALNASVITAGGEPGRRSIMEIY